MTPFSQASGTLIFWFGGLAILLAITTVMVLVYGWLVQPRASFRAVSSGVGTLILLILTAMAEVCLDSSRAGSRGSGGSQSAVAAWLGQVPTLVVAIALGIIVLVEAVMAFLIRQRQPRVLTHTAVKTALDSLPDGICFVDQRGEVLLTNRKMRHLAERILGRPMLNGLDLLAALESEDFFSGTVLTRQPLLCTRDADGNVWRWESRHLEEPLEHVIEVLAVNITEAYEIGWELDRQALRLAGIKDSQRQYQIDLENTKFERREMQRRLRVPGTLETALATTNQMLETREGDAKRLLRVWEETDLLHTRHHGQRRV